MSSKITLYRAADDDYVAQGYSFATCVDVAEAYQDNPGFGGGTIYSCTVDVADGQVLDLTDVSTSELADMFGRVDPGAIGVDEWVPRDPKLQDAIAAAGYSWVTVRESYPADSVTWIWVGDSSDEPELAEADCCAELS